MALQKNRTSSWIRQDYNSLKNRKIQCKICSYTIIHNLLRLKVHLFRAHKIFLNEDKDYKIGYDVILQKKKDTLQNVKFVINSFYLDIQQAT